MRYAWDLQHQYLRESGLEKGVKGYLARFLLHRLRLWDQRTANGVDHFVANSEFIARRIWKAYRREATVIYPAINTSQFTLQTEKEPFYLAASRLVPYKKMDLIVESFAAMPDKKLVVIGDGPDLQKVKRYAGPNTEILGYQSTSVLIDYMQRATGLIFAAEEDFGLVPVEAQACGTPVIAFGKGGALETVRGLDKTYPTGLFFEQQTVASVCEAVEVFEKNRERFTADNCAKNAAKFAPEAFRSRIKQYVQEKTRERSC
jgi:glycosyltransferase involved in cell wall biosynthesis